MIAQPWCGKQAVSRIGAFKSPFLSMVPSWVVKTLVTLSAAKATIPFRRLRFLHDLAGFAAGGEKTDETQARRQGWCSSESGVHRAECSRHRCGGTRNLRSRPGGSRPETGSLLLDIYGRPAGASGMVARLPHSDGRD